MREIKFRGKRVDNGEWVYGYLYGINAIIELTSEYTVTSIGTIIMGIHQVDPATVGQYAGLHDKNGVEIYEGDIDSNGFVFTFNTAMGGWYRMKNGGGFSWHSDCLTHGGTRLPFEIIGNTYANPELLEVV